MGSKEGLILLWNDSVKVQIIKRNLNLIHCEVNQILTYMGLAMYVWASFKK